MIAVVNKFQRIKSNLRIPSPPSSKLRSLTSALKKSSLDNGNFGAGLFTNSFYKPSATSTPAGTTGVTWISAAINTTSLIRFATNYDATKTQLLPIPQVAKDANINMYQNFGY